ncbi:MAG TPA: hypothetical protein VEJ36_00320 [Nitrososphaerales archaeon]|nr:hypothetical protein [Nitrososphaerales archaeon]
MPVAIALGKPHLTVRKTPKGYGAGGRLIGPSPNGRRFVHIADLITNGASAMEWVEAISEAGGTVERYLVVVDRDQGGRAALKSKGIELGSLLTLDERLLELAAEQGSISGEAKSSIAEYLDDPEEWSRDFLRRNPSFITERVQSSGGRISLSEGIDILRLGYPELVPEFRRLLIGRFAEIGVDPGSATKAIEGL